MANKFSNFLRLIFGLSKGSAGYFKNTASDTKAFIYGDKEIKKLLEKIKNQQIDYHQVLAKYKKKYPFMDSAVIAGLTISEMIDNGVSKDVQLAYELSFANKSKNISFLETWNSFDDPEQRLGFVNTIKGKLFEIKYIDHLNANLEPGYIASIAESSTQKGWDIEITGPDEEVINQIQLKATASVNYVKEHIEKYPNIDIVTLEDLKGEIGLNDKISFATLSNDELQAEILSSTSNYEYAPFLIGMGYVVFSSYLKKDLNFFEKNIDIGDRGTGVIINGAIIVSTGLVFGLIAVIAKEIALNKGNKKREYINYLKEQIELHNNSLSKLDKKFSRRDFLKGLFLTAGLGRYAIKKL